MPNVVCGMAALSVACIFYTWRAYNDLVMAKNRRLRDRVTYMLWVAAQRSSELVACA